MARWIRVRYQVERLLVLLSGSALVLTVLIPDWIERLLGAAPDGGNGSIEWGLVLGLLTSTAALIMLVWRDRRILNAAT
ncbi:MAG TPA: hypothetical protein VIJ07_06445 [Dermatophilaceae bacterium]|jgi:hypothetical protein